jgi:hypothetical protein
MGKILPDIYKERPAVCSPEAIEQERSHGSEFYSVQKYAGAQKIFTALLRKCAFFMGRTQTYWLLNDEAISYYKNGDPKACLEILTTMKEWSDNAIHRPLEADSIRNLRLSVMENYKLCKKRAMKK